jgi:hypothetical protein
MNAPLSSHDREDFDILEQELLKGLESPARELTKEDWEMLGRRVRKRQDAGSDHE